MRYIRSTQQPLTYSITYYDDYNYNEKQKKTIACTTTTTTVHCPRSLYRYHRIGFHTRIYRRPYYYNPNVITAVFVYPFFIILIIIIIIINYTILYYNILIGGATVI